MVGEWRRIVDRLWLQQKGGKSRGWKGKWVVECSSPQFPNSIFERKPLCVFSLLLHFCLLICFFSFSFFQLRFWKSSLFFLVSAILLLCAVYFFFSSLPVILRRTRKLSIGWSYMFWFFRSWSYHLLNVVCVGLWHTRPFGLKYVLNFYCLVR